MVRMIEEYLRYVLSVMCSMGRQIVSIDFIGLLECKTSKAICRQEGLIWMFLPTEYLPCRAIPTLHPSVGTSLLTMTRYHQGEFSR